MIPYIYHPTILGIGRMVFHKRACDPSSRFLASDVLCWPDFSRGLTVNSTRNVSPTFAFLASRFLCCIIGQFLQKINLHLPQHPRILCLSNETSSLFNCYQSSCMPWSSPLTIRLPRKGSRKALQWDAHFQLVPSCSFFVLTDWICLTGRAWSDPSMTSPHNSTASELPTIKNKKMRMMVESASGMVFSKQTCLKTRIFVSSLA
jgi:hypothetical protein